MVISWIELLGMNEPKFGPNVATVVDVEVHQQVFLLRLLESVAELQTDSNRLGESDAE